MAGPDFAGCPPSVDDLVEKEIDRILTQYRESDKLLAVIRADLEQIAEAIQVGCSIPDYFDLDTAVGHQLTLLGKRMGWPREHCYCVSHPVFGFDCDDPTGGYSLEGFCVDGIRWSDCIDFGVGTISIDDDELYRKFLKVRRYQYLSLYDIDSLTECVKIMFGDTGLVLDAGNRRVVLAPGRALSKLETSMLPLYRRIMPVAMGIEVYFHLGNVPVFGFGEGWGGFCDIDIPGQYSAGAEWMCPELFDCATPDAGVGEIPVYLELWPQVYSTTLSQATVEYQIEEA